MKSVIRLLEISDDIFLNFSYNMWCIHYHCNFYPHIYILIHVITVLNLAELVGSFMYNFYFLGNTTARTDGVYLPDGHEA